MFIVSFHGFRKAMNLPSGEIVAGRDLGVAEEELAIEERRKRVMIAARTVVKFDARWRVAERVRADTAAARRAEGNCRGGRNIWRPKTCGASWHHSP